MGRIIRRASLAALAIFLETTVLYAHGYPIYPVEIDFRVYADVIRVWIESNQCYWVGDVLGESEPPLAWTDAQKIRIEKYLDDHFQVVLDTTPLKSHVLTARTAQDPWENALQGRVYFTVTYDLPSGRGRTLRGRATFYREWVDHLKATHEPLDSSEVPQKFMTDLRVVGPSTHRFTLTLDHPDFELPLAEATRASWQAHIDPLTIFLRGMARDLAFIGCFVLAIGLFVYYRNRQPKGDHTS